MRQPRDRVGLSRTRGVLHQIVAARATLSRVRLQAPHSVPLVEPREDHVRTSPRSLRWPLHMHEAAQDVHPGVAAPHLLPEVGRSVPLGIRGVARAKVAAPVERQEPRAGTGQAGGHHHRGRIDREVHHAHPAQGPVAGRTDAAVLGDCVLDALARQRVLQLGGGHRHPVHEQAQVDSAPAGRVEGQLPGHRQHVGVVEGGQVRR